MCFLNSTAAVWPQLSKATYPYEFSKENPLNYLFLKVNKFKVLKENFKNLKSK